MATNARRGGLGRTVGALALGVTAGSLLALLYTPVSGPVIRRRIRRQLRAFQATAVRQLQRSRTQLIKQARRLREAAVERVGGTRDWVAERLPIGNGRHPVSHRAAHSA